MLKYGSTGDAGTDAFLDEIWTDVDRLKTASKAAAASAAAAAAAPVVVVAPQTAPAAASLTVSQTDGTQSGPVMVLEFDATTGVTVTQGDSAAVISSSGVYTQPTPELRLVESSGSTYSRWNRNSGGLMEFLTQGKCPGIGYALSSPTGGNFCNVVNFGALPTFTIEQWVKVYAISQNAACINYLGTSGGSNNTLNLCTIRNGLASSLQYRLGYTTGGVSYNGSITVFDGNWHHVALTYDGTSLKAYVDGVSDLSVTPAISLYTSATSELFLFAYGAGYSPIGRMDECKIYSVAKTQAAVQADYNLGVGVYGTTPDTNLVAGYHFDEDTGTTLTDYSGNGHTGGYVNTAGVPYSTGLIQAPSSSFEAEVIVASAGSGQYPDQVTDIQLGNTASGMNLLGRTITLGTVNDAGTPAITLNEDGWVGFNTTNPQAPFSVGAAPGGSIASFLNSAGTSLFSFQNPGNLVLSSGQTFQLINNAGYTVMNVAASYINFPYQIVFTGTGGIQLPGGSGFAGIFTSGSATNIGINNWFNISGTSGHLLYPNADSTTAISVGQAAGSGAFVQFDTTNKQTAIGQSGAPNSPLQVGGAISLPITATPLTSSTPLTSAHYTALVNCTGGALTITLPTAVGIQGREYVIKKTDSSANAVTLATTSSQTIDGAASLTISAQYSLYRVQSDNANWQVIGKM